MATSQPMKGLVSPAPRGVTRIPLAAAAVALIAAPAIVFAIAGPHSTGSAATVVDRAAADALVQFRANERQERYAPSVDQIRRALIDFRRSERVE